ncbi:MerR family transcriptional regulator [Streptomyces sp. ICN441]|uniref:MerR family transcriptional regulator n=1 Tax=Streptomyces tirandamycinicus TaxID=2174846 RepID=A0A2S1SP85_9ACTN|nr:MULTISPECIES: MerR family transcriptional regulator [Streptomyces]AWI28167.1 MerR family transcriptional regulator [Streptomyces tirandamycinicus]TFE37230.1 MerR family transcriptional regulator [Streptomyces sp. ICN441]
MRIGEIAALVGVTPRAVRHYHHQGLLPEPVRRANGYRDYSVRDAVLLARIRRLTELGLGLEEVGDVLADDEGRELVEVLEELDDDLAVQQALLAERRARLGAVLEQARAGRLPAEGPVSPELAELLGGLAREAAGRPESASAAREREVLALLDTVVPPGDRDRLLGVMRRMTEAPGAVERVYEVYGLLDALADGGGDGGGVAREPRVEEAARALADCIPDEVVAELAKNGAPAGEGGSTFLDAFFAEFPPAQAEAVRRALRLVAERAR